MCAISGFFLPYVPDTGQRSRFLELLDSMARVQAHRGPDGMGVWLSGHFGLSHARLSIIDPDGGAQPMKKQVSGQTFAISYNGELYNADELRRELICLGHHFETNCDTEVILEGYLEYGSGIASRLNGMFAFAVADPVRSRLLLCRDRAGIKPLFYTQSESGAFVFASEIKGLFAFPDIVPSVSRAGLNEIFSLGPARTPGSAVFNGIYELLPGQLLSFDGEKISKETYWNLISRPHEESPEETAEHLRWLVKDAVKRQMVSDVPICTFLSGGLDSSLVSSICAGVQRASGKRLTTFSFDLSGNDLYFRSNEFQPSQDSPYAAQMAEYLNTEHHFLECSSQRQAELLTQSVLAHDLPAMGDIDSSLLAFCSLVHSHCKVALTGECADEIFGGYPWFHKKELMSARTFPWSADIKARSFLLKPEFAEYLQMERYVSDAYQNACASAPIPEDTPPDEARERTLYWLNLKWFMQTLLNRMDRTSMYCGLEARVPFADHRIIEYMWNVPRSMKSPDGVPKGLLRQAARGLLPDSIISRPKSPYPKTYDLAYEKLLADQVSEIAGDSGSPVMEFLDRNRLELFLSSPKDYGRPWYGQLMAGPQMLAYLIQINFWLKHYHVRVEAASRSAPY